MKGHAPKSVQDRILKGMILQTLLRAEDQGISLNSRDIHNYIRTNEFFFESPENDRYGDPLFSGNYSYDNLPGIRSELTYMRHAGYLSKDGDVKPFIFNLTAEGRLHAEDPFFKYRLKMEYAQKIIEERVKRALSDDDYVTQLAEDKRIEMCKTCKLNKPLNKRLPARTWTVKPHQGKIGLQRKDGSIREIEVTDEGQIKELEDLKAILVRDVGGKIDRASTILSMQNENAKMKEMLTKAGIKIGDLDTQLTKERGGRGRLDKKTIIRQMTRLEAAHYYYEGGYWLDSEFFDIWKGSLRVIEYKRLIALDGILNVYYDIQSTRSEIMTRTDFSKRILEPDEIHNIEIMVTEIRDNSIVVDSERFKAPKVLTV